MKINIPAFFFGFSLLLTTGPLFVQADEIPPPPATPPPVEPADTPVPYHYQVPKQLSDGWPVGDFQKEKVDAGTITQDVADIRAGKIPDMHSLLIFRHGKLLLEEYFNHSKADVPHALNSCTKSVFTTVYGIAQEQGLISLNQRISDLYPDSAAKGWGKDKADITVGSLLSMTSGLGCDDTAQGSENCGAQMNHAEDWLGFCFSRPVAHPVGKVWMYNGCCLSLISTVIAQKSGMSFPDYAKKVLLGPLGITEDDWITGPGSINRVDYGLGWKSRDMAKLGQLYLNRGKWKGKQIVPEAWLKDATTPHSPLGEAWGHDYGYLWHLQDMMYQGRKVHVFYASGFQGQAILVSPDADLVCVMTAGSSDNEIYGKEVRLFEKDILGSCH